MFKSRQKKRRIIQKAKVFILGCLTTVMFSSTACAKTPEATSGFPKNKTIRTEIAPDSVVISKLGDSICDIVFNPKKVTLYTLEPLERPKDEDSTIGGFKTNEKVGTIAKEYYSTVLFLLSDSCSYYDGPFVPATAFSPEVALEFSNRKGKVYLLYSFASREIGIVADGTLLKKQHYGNHRLFLLFFQNILKDEYYAKLLNNILP